MVAQCPLEMAGNGSALFNTSVSSLKDNHSEKNNGFSLKNRIDQETLICTSLWTCRYSFITGIVIENQGTCVHICNNSIEPFPGFSYFVLLPCSPLL